MKIFNSLYIRIILALQYYLCVLGAVSAQVISNHGTVAVIPSGVVLTGGALVNSAGTFTNNGSIMLSGGITNAAVLDGDGVYALGGDWMNNGGTFSAGSSGVTLNGTSLQTLGGTTTSSFNHLTLNNPAGTALGNDETVNGILTMTSGKMDCGTHVLVLGTSTSSTGMLSWTSGNIIGKFKRWVNGAGTGILFPVGTAVDNEAARVTFTDLAVGSLTAAYEPGDPGNNSGFPLMDGSATIGSAGRYAEGSWLLIPGDSLAGTGYAIELTGNGFTGGGVWDSTVRIIKRPDGGGDWIADGFHVAGSAFTAKRSGLNGFSRFAHAKPCYSLATVTPGGPGEACQDASPSSITLTGAGVGGSATTGAWSITGLNPANGGDDGHLSSTAQEADPASVTYTPPAGYAGTVTLALTTDDPSSPECMPASLTRTIVLNARRKLSGTFFYFNNAGTVLTQDVSVGLYLNGSLVTGTSANPQPITGSGEYQFTDLCTACTYELRATSVHPVEGAVNTTDAAQLNYWGTHQVSIEKVRFLAGDVTGSGYFINGTDAGRIQQYFVGGTPFDRPDWIFWKMNDPICNNSQSPSMMPAYPNITLSTGSDLTADMYGMCTGDFNGSFNPALTKSASASLDLIYTGNSRVGPDQEFDLPVRVLNASAIGAVSLILDFPGDLVEVKDVDMDDAAGEFDWALKGNELRIGWHSQNPLVLGSFDKLMNLKLQTTAAFTPGKTIRFALAANPLNELADEKYDVIGDAVLGVEAVYALPAVMEDDDLACSLMLGNHPNPFNGSTTITYTLPFKGDVTLEIRNMLGETVMILVNETQREGGHSLKFDAGSLLPGVYTATLRLRSSSNEFIRTIKLVNSNE